MQDFRNLEAWNKAHQLALRVHEASKLLPKEELFGITMMLRRSSIHIPSKMAEGSAKPNAEFAVDLRRAIGSASELEYLILMAKDLGHWTAQQADALMADTVEVRKMAYGLVRTL